MPTEPLISVGILHSKRIKFILYGEYIVEQDYSVLSGQCTAEIKGESIVISSVNKKTEYKKEVVLVPQNIVTEYFSLRDVVIGVQFHWERKEKESFRGSLKFYRDNEELHAINLIPIERYLISVISSEMSAKSSINLLKAHAVISRSWLIAQIEKSKSIKEKNETYSTGHKTDDELIRWYDREDHLFFDVCADDHCQRYQGISKVHTEAARHAVEETRGLVLTFNDIVCDARFSKSCGGISEAFENVWEPTPFPFLSSIIDYKFEPDNYLIDFSNEKNVTAWVEGYPHAFCNTSDKKILAQVLLDYDQETADFYRWKKEYNQEELSQLIKEKSGIDFGDILDFIPIERGASGRLIKLKIVGTKKTLTIGKELEIRRTLSKTHLYSSAFVIEKENIVDGIPGKFVFKGAGWGHGVGLCQIGAAVMAEQGYSFDVILLHYYKGAKITRRY